MVKFCSKCKKILPIEAVFCPTCGNQNLLQYCQNCKKIVPNGVKSCPTCGSGGTTQIAVHQKETVKPQKKKKGRVFLAFLLLAVVIGGLFAYKNDIFHDLFMTDEKRDQEISKVLREDGVYAAVELVREYYHESNPEKAAKWYLSLMDDLEEEIVDDVEIIDTEVEWEWDNTHTYYMKVKNNSSHTLSYIQVNVYLMDEDHNIIESMWTNWSGTLPPGASTTLDKMYDLPEDGKYIKASVSEVSIDW